MYLWKIFLIILFLHRALFFATPCIRSSLVTVHSMKFTPVHTYNSLISAGKHERIHFANDSTGHSYEKIFSRCLDEKLTEVHVEEPYIRQGHQTYNFLRFCELLVGSTKCSVKRIYLKTRADEVRTYFVDFTMISM